MGVTARIGLLAGLAAALAGIAAASDGPRTAVIGDLTFTWPAESWRIEQGGDWLVATCVQEDCRDAVIDISRRDGEAGCTKAAMVAEAERLFPAGQRAYANVFPAGRFALVLAERHAGPELSSPEYVHGCLAWQGSEYRFAMRPETVGTQSWVGGALHYLVSRASAPVARVEKVRLGEVDFSVSAEFWTVSGDAADGTVLLTCRMPTCPAPELAATLSVRSPPEPCSGEAGLQPIDMGETRVETLAAEAPGGLDFTITETYLGCRNYVPPHFAACAVHNGRSYHLSTFGPHGCRFSSWSIPLDALTDLLKGARVAE